MCQSCRAQFDVSAICFMSSTVWDLKDMQWGNFVSKPEKLWMFRLWLLMRSRCFWEQFAKKKKKSGLFQYFIGNVGGVHSVLHQKLDRADSSSVQQTRGGLITTFCQFKTCDKATFAHKNCLILQNRYMLCKNRHLLSPSRLQDEKVHHLFSCSCFFVWEVQGILQFVQHNINSFMQSYVVYLFGPRFHCPLRFQTWWSQPADLSTWQQVIPQQPLKML